MKRCKKCLLEKYITDFHKDNKNKDGLCIYCKDCRRKIVGYGKTRRWNYKWEVDSKGYLAWKGIRLHRKIMEEHLGRKLSFDEKVHHINENKLDNRIENLELINQSEHSKIHSSEIAKKMSNGSIYRCIKCGKEKYKPKSHTPKHYKNEYKCQECRSAYKSTIDLICIKCRSITKKYMCQIKNKSTINNYVCIKCR